MKPVDGLCIEKDVPTLKSSLWKMQHELYTSASIADYAVPDSSPFQASVSFLAYVAMTVSVYS